MLPNLLENENPQQRKRSGTKDGNLQERVNFVQGLHVALHFETSETKAKTIMADFGALSSARRRETFREMLKIRSQGPLLQYAAAFQ